jgi:hypothetical protein
VWKLRESALAHGVGSLNSINPKPFSLMILESLFRKPSERQFTLDGIGLEDLRHELKKAVALGKDSFVWRYDGEDLHFDTENATILLEDINAALGNNPLTL